MNVLAVSIVQIVTPDLFRGRIELLPILAIARRPVS